MEKRDFKSFICKPFCRFFKEGQKKDMACQGAVVMARLLKCGAIHLDSLPRKGKHHTLWQTHDSLIDTHVCGFCPFRKDGCDFQSKNPPADVEPCGGYIILRLLLATSMLKAEHLKEVTNG